MAQPSTLPQTLKSITTTKINEVTKLRDAFNVSHAQTLHDAECQSEPKDKVDRLLKGASKLEGVFLAEESSSDLSDTEPSTTAGKALKNKHRFLRQVSEDPSFSPATLSELQSDLEQGL